MEMTRFDVTLCSWNSPAALAGSTRLYLSRSVSAKQSSWLQNLWTDAGTCVLDISHFDRQAIHWHLGKHMTKCHRQSSWSMEKADTCKHEGKRTSLWTSAKLKPALFGAIHYPTSSFQNHQQSAEENALFCVISEIQFTANNVLISVYKQKSNECQKTGSEEQCCETMHSFIYIISAEFGSKQR